MYVLNFFYLVGYRGLDPAHSGKKFRARFTNMLAIPFGYHFTRGGKKNASLIQEMEYQHEFMIY